MAIKPLNSVAGFSVGETPNVVIQANGDITTTNLTVAGEANLGPIGNVTITGGTSGQVIQTDGSGTLSFVTVDTWRIQNGTSNVAVATLNGNVTVAVAGNANIATFTGTGANIQGYLTVEGTVTANGNISANNYLVTPATKDLIIAPATNLIRSDANINPYNDNTYNLGNNLARWANIYSKEANVTGNANIGSVRTDNLLKANGTPWDFATAAGSNTWVQYSDGTDLAASANFTYNDATQVLGINGNISISNATATNGILTDNLYYSNGSPWDIGGQPAGANTQIQFNNGANDFAASANLTFNTATNLLTVTGNANVSGTTKTNQVQLTSLLSQQLVFGNGSSYIVGSNNLTWDGSNLNVTGNVDSSGTVLANTVSANITVSAGNLSVVNNVTSNLIPDTNKAYNLGNATFAWNNIYANNFVGNISGNITAPGENTQIIFNDALVANAVANFTYDKAYNLGGGQLNVGQGAGGKIITDSFYAAFANVNGDIEIVGNASVGENLLADTISSNGSISITGATGNLTLVGGNITGANVVSANTGSFVTGDISGTTTTGNLTVNVAISGNTANFTGNIKALNANLGNLVTANYVNVANDINVLGNVNAANLVGPLANGSSNVKVYNNANVEVSVGGNANIATFSTTGLYVTGEINTTAGNILSNGNVTANGFLNGANANITGEAQLGSVLTANITAPAGNITISAAGTNENIILAPSGTGTVDTGLHRITQVGAPVDPTDAVTKEYADSIGQGLFIHAPVTVEANVALNGTYAQGGTTQTTTTISGGKTITFSANHGLSVNDGIVWTNSFNGIVGGEAYWVQTVPALDQITIRDGYFGAEVTTLTNGTGLTQASRANPGVGATITNAGANAALVIDSIAVANGDRVLVYTQASSYENGVYDVTDKGNASAAWVLTRSSDMNKYVPKSTTGLGSGDYFFVSEGANAAGESYVLTSPEGEVIIGTDGIIFTQFQAAGSYTAGNGIAITGTVISANVDNVTTAISSGNIVIKTSANLTTPNIGDATFSSLTWNTLSNGNVSANNLSTSNIANIGLDLTVGGLAQVSGNISSNNWVNANNIFVTTNANVQGNVIAGNITANATVFSANSNVSGTTITNVLTVNNSIGGNTANFSGNLVANNIKSNLEFVGNTANFSGNVRLPNLTVNLELSGNTANFSGNVIVPNLSVNLELAGNTANFSGNINALNANLGNLAIANYFTGTLINGTSNVRVINNGNINLTAGGNTTLVVTATGANITGNLDVTGNFNVGALEAANVKADTSVFVGNTTVTWANATTTSVAANQTISSYTLTGTEVTGVQWLVKGTDSTGSKYSVATVQAVTDGTNVDYAVYGTVQLGGYTGSLAVNIVGSTVRLQVTPSSSNSTVWTTQYRLV